MNDEAFTAAREGNVNRLKELLDQGIGVDAKDENGLTLLHLATSFDQYEVVKCLLENGADVLLGTDEGETVLHIAVAKNDESLVKVILENAARDKLKCLVNAKIKATGTAALHVAAKRNYHKLASILLEYGANFEVKNAAGERPIDLATNKQLRQLLELVNSSFERAKSSDESLAHDLESASDLSPIFNCRNNGNRTLAQTFVLHLNINAEPPSECDNARADELLQLRVNRAMDRDASALSTWTRREKIDELIARVRDCRRICFLGKAASREFTKLTDCFYLTSTKYFASLTDMMKGLDKARDVLAILREMKGSLTADVTTRGLDEIFEFFGDHLDKRDKNERYNFKLPAEWKGDTASFLGSMLTHAGSLLYRSIISLDYCLATALLFRAVKRGDFNEMCRLISESPAEPHVVDDSARTVLCHAAENDEVQMVKLLVKHFGANPPQGERALSTIRSVVGKLEPARLQSLQSLLGYDANPSYERTFSSVCPILSQLDAKSAKSLIKIDFTPNGGRAMSPIYLAASKGHARSVKAMLKRIETQELAELIDRREELGDTALHVAAKLGRLDLVKMLLKHGASYEVLNAEGSTPLDVSTNEEVTELLTLVDGCFRDGGEANVELVYKLKAMSVDLFLMVAGTKNRDGQTLAVVAGKAGAKNVAGVILKMIRDAKQNEE